jgi:8-oxo-dGTP diphosphatase
MLIPEVRVSAGIILQDNKALLTLRSEKQFIPSVWQFPGGKANGNETPIRTLKRELKEELDIDVLDAHLLAIQTYQFAPTQEWIIYFYLINMFDGEIIPAENQILSWTSIHEFDDLPIIKPTRRIMDILKMANVTKPKNDFIWENIWSLETKEFSSYQTRIRRAGIKIQTLQKIGLQPRNSERIIDVGSGTGEVAIFLKEKYSNIQYETLCVEKSPNAVGKLRSRIPKDGTIEVIESDVCNIPVPSDFFDKVFAISIIEHVQEVGSFLREINRIIKSDGELYISQSNKMSAHRIDWHIRKFFHRWPYGYQKYYTPSELNKLLQSWFKIEETMISLPDSDAPIHRFIDKAINAILPNWGRNIFVRARRIK